MHRLPRTSASCLQIPLDRRCVLTGAVGLIGATFINRAIPMAQATPTAGLNGIGLTRAEFSARYGEPAQGQGASVYQVAGENYYVTNTSTVPTDLVVSVYWGGDSPAAGATADVVNGRLAQFLPVDAVRTGTGDAPTAGIGPRVRVDTYNSPLVASAFAGTGFVDTGDMLMVYSYIPDLSSTVAWANLYVGVKQ